MIPHRNSRPVQGKSNSTDLARMRENPRACYQACSGEGVVSHELIAQRRPGRSWPPGTLHSAGPEGHVPPGYSEALT
ncbi:MAG: hypothetical protein OXC42_08360 [Gammaproteobacteria bacterium]|nr:hypothetical protein [Gammaproteobacteria bacterium]